ncbi:liver-expressed antimicrobial peptide 2 [Callorhinchus milii]|uniref:Liver-expressed antimicrobial peptide 2 n=1 Tax=Callorhinchus milii TaxID=7868 RepID=V9LG19_CALMI|nr:liver-expressed antimicrobial peptide 2 [Callorhinchus milii]|eukprot:gi/632958566/ref/XP_007895115.1/ PREDICTED: liver-expressed antimicrobial peptide 2-like [Callorhinchus milii]
MRSHLSRALAVSCILCLLCSITVQSATGPNVQREQLVQRIRRSMLWRWITQRPVGATCRDNSECITNYCAIQDTTAQCSLQTFSE